jgi:thiol-disulfide isomerase/thioredoxin
VWQLAFQVKPPVEFPQVRAQITADLERLQVLEQHDRVAWLRTLAEGYELTSDTAGKERVQARLTELQPCSMSVLQNRVKAWEEANPRPEEDATEEVRQAHNQGILDFTLPLLERCPGADLLWLRAVTAAGAVKPPREDLVDQGAERLLAAARAGRLSVGRPMESHLADIYLQAKLDPERAYSLIQAASRSRIEDREKKLSNEGLPESFRQRIERMIPVDDLSHLLQLTRAETRTGRLEESRSTLEAVEAQMEIVTAAAEENEDFASSLPRWRARIFREYGDLAEAEGRRQDAALYLYRAAALGNGEETAERAAALWRESGGTAAAWAALSGEASEEETPPPGRWDDKGETLPALALSDLKGKSWGWTEFEGKTVLANIWATWCAPCRAEHPYIQKLHEQLKDRDDLKIITLNVDFNPGVVTPYLEENGYSFPVLLAMDYVEEVVGSLSIPRNWLLRGDGTLLKEQLGFDPTESEAEWLASTLTLLEAAAGGEAASD